MAATTTPSFKGERQKSNTCLNEIAFARLPLLVGGKLPVDATVTVDTLTVSEVKLLDSAGTNKAAINASGQLACNVAASVLPTGAATAAKQPALGTAGTASTNVITVQGIASMTALLVDASATTQPVSVASLPLPSGAATSALQGALTETAPATDTASSGTNGRLQRVAQRLTSLIALLPASLGIKTSAASLSVAPSSDGVFPVTGTFWQATQPVSGTVATTAPVGTLVNSSAYEASHVLKASAGTLISVSGYNSGPTQWIQLFNSATVPSNAATPVKTFQVPATSNFSSDVPITGIPFSVGISVSNSSTGSTKTIGSNDVFFTAVVL